MDRKDFLLNQMMAELESCKEQASKMTQTFEYFLDGHRMNANETAKSLKDCYPFKMSETQFNCETIPELKLFSKASIPK